MDKTFFIHVRGTKKAVKMVYHSTSAYPNTKLIDFEKTNSEPSILHFHGESHAVMGKEWEGSAANMSIISEQRIPSEAEKYIGYSMKALSKLFSCEIQERFWTENTGYGEFNYYNCGEMIWGGYCAGPTDGFDDFEDEDDFAGEGDEINEDEEIDEAEDEEEVEFDF